MTDWKENERKQIINALNRIADNLGRIANGTKAKGRWQWQKCTILGEEMNEVETGWRELFFLDGMSQFIKKEMDELLKSPWAQDKTLTPHDMAVKEAFATVKDLILSKFEIKEGWENSIH